VERTTHLPFGNEHKVGQACDNDRAGPPHNHHAKGGLMLPGRMKRDMLEGTHSVHYMLEGARITALTSGRLKYMGLTCIYGKVLLCTSSESVRKHSGQAGIGG
jgi:hypothetical protein